MLYYEMSMAACEAELVLRYQDKLSEASTLIRGRYGRLDCCIAPADLSVLLWEWLMNCDAEEGDLASAIMYTLGIDEAWLDIHDRFVLDRGERYEYVERNDVDFWAELLDSVKENKDELV